jgi:hypothetical protein
MEYPEQRYVRIGLYRSLVMVDLESEPGHLELRDQDSAHSKRTAGEIQAIVLDMQGNPSGLQQYLCTYLRCGFCVPRERFINVL